MSLNKAKNVLHIDNVTMQFGGVIAVDNISIDIFENEIVAIIGPNGAGKTTAFNVITGVYEPTNGEIDFYGKPIIRNHPQGKMRKMYKGKNADRYQGSVLNPTTDKITALGMSRTFQNIRLFKSMTVFDNVLVAKHMLRTSKLFSAMFKLNKAEEKQQRAEVLELLKKVGLEDVKDEIATSLPYGKQRRLEIVRALATKPKLLLLDEPAAGMNPQETMELTRFIGLIRKEFGISILLIEHHMNLVMDISDRIYVLNFGGLIASGTPKEIQSDPEVIEAYLGGAEDVGD